MANRGDCGLCGSRFEWSGSEPFCANGMCVNSALSERGRAWKAYQDGVRDARLGNGLYYSGPFCSTYLAGARGFAFDWTR